MIETAAEAHVQFQPGAGLVTVFHVEAALVTAHQFAAQYGRVQLEPHSVSQFGDEEIAYRRLELVVDEFRTEVKRVAVVGRVLEMRVGADVIDVRVVAHRLIESAFYFAVVGVPVGIFLVQLLAQTVAVTGESDLRVGENLARVAVLPVQGAHQVAPAHAHIQVAFVLVADKRLVERIAEVHHVVTRVERSRQFVVLGEGVTEFGVHVVEIVAAGGVHVRCRFGNQRDKGRSEQIEIRPAGRDVESRLGTHRVAGGKTVPVLFVPVDGAFHIQFGGQQSYGQVAVVTCGVAVVLSHVDDRTQAAAVAGGEIAFIERHVLDSVGVEDREETHQVTHVVEGHAVQQNQVFIRSAAAHVDARGAFAAGLHAREQLDGFENIHFSTDGGDAFDLRDRHFDGRHLRRLRARDGLMRHDRHLFQTRVAMERDGDKRIFPEVQHYRLGRMVAHVADLHRVLAGGQRQGVESGGVRHRTVLRDRIQHGRTDEALARLGVRHIAVDGVLLRKGRTDECQKPNKSYD